MCFILIIATKKSVISLTQEMHFHGVVKITFYFNGNGTKLFVLRGKSNLPIDLELGHYSKIQIYLGEWQLKLFDQCESEVSKLSLRHLKSIVINTLTLSKKKMHMNYFYFLKV